MQGDIAEILPAERNTLENGELPCEVKEPSTCSLSSMEKNELIHICEIYDEEHEDLEEVRHGILLVNFEIH